MPKIGDVRKGSPKQSVTTESGRTYDTVGKDLKYFRVEFDAQETEAAAVFKGRYGDTPAELNIWLPYDEIDLVWERWNEAYTRGMMVARADDEHFLFLRGENGQVLVQNGLNLKTGQPEPYRKDLYLAGKNMVQCKPVGRLKVIIPELRRLAVLVVHTTSINDILNINGHLATIQMFAHGHLRGIPLVLRRRPQLISVPDGTGRRIRVEKWLLSIEADPIWVARKFEQIQYLALTGGRKFEEVDGQWVEEEEEGEESSKPLAVSSQPSAVSSQPSAGSQAEKKFEYVAEGEGDLLSPEGLKNNLRMAARAKVGRQADYDLRKHVQQALRYVFAYEADPVKAMMVTVTWLTGATSFDLISDEMALALAEWLNPSLGMSGMYLASDKAVKEARAVLALITK